MTDLRTHARVFLSALTDVQRRLSGLGLPLSRRLRRLSMSARAYWPVGVLLCAVPTEGFRHPAGLVTILIKCSLCLCSVI